MAIFLGTAIAGLIIAFMFVIGGDALNWSEEWPVFLIWIFMIATPFGLLAIFRIQTVAPWVTGIALTLVFWGGLILSAFKSTADHSGVNFGYIFLMLASPLIISAITLLVARASARP